MHRTIRSLADVAAAKDSRQFTAFLKELVDLIVHHAERNDFRFASDLPLPAGLLEPRPAGAAAPWMDAYLCALAEHLADMAGKPPPPWSNAGFLDAPVFLGGPHSHEHLLKDTPPAFRRRLIFPGRVLIKLDRLRRTA